MEELAAAINAILANLTHNDLKQNSRNIKNLRELVDEGTESVRIV